MKTGFHCEAGIITFFNQFQEAYQLTDILIYQNNYMQWIHIKFNTSSALTFDDNFPARNIT